MEKLRKPKKVFLEGAISPNFIADSIAKHSTKLEIGAHSIFLGQVRNDQHNTGQIVAAIEYTTYTEMAEAILHEIREAIFAKYSLTCMHIYHSLGLVLAGEISLFVFTSSKHRRDAIDACNEIVERIKKEVPIWGKEILQDNEGHVWKENT
ncbi:MAG: molybdenum cofactor biosynthesis protein MoaE [Sphingobacteriales bacterium]|jgi:molybdopterin synthase catalytic subunit|nr:molybdenum cofactor biosynthesis protein MoaE [Sphingobacteriales bacterium]MBP9140642.1 molybdenum cofactor biosynthesis protein MoaE [Chitinophagales bacterium]MDA0198937.1 molybdenum cofactor biosynthesis protein MoaE [Bacteroidota bacterium]MBK7528423.1 molybdenum cofactor biosynthesis protein MoaE [Sphingobacteriales bacterium]MBK8679615.1 molybdenum cofactor biosynthesis protein MoaE [Sphingobacteriales bacterium]